MMRGESTPTALGVQSFLAAPARLLPLPTFVTRGLLAEQKTALALETQAAAILWRHYLATSVGGTPCKFLRMSTSMQKDFGS